MKHPEIVEKGRRYANGDGVMIDLEKAYRTWRLVEYDLAGDDLNCYLDLCTYYDDRLVRSYDSQSNAFASNMDFSNLSAKTVTHHTAEDVRREFEDIMKDADPEIIDRIHKMLEKAKNGTQKKERKPENINAGNNLGFIMCQLKWNRHTMRTRVEKLLLERFDRGTSKGKSNGWTEAAFSQAINGVNGMSEAVKTCIARCVNEENERRIALRREKLLNREFIEQDIDLPITELIKVFYKPDLTDPRIQKLLGEK